MFKRFIKNLSMRNRLIFIACVCVILPLFILSFLQFRSLVELENKTKDAYKENLRYTLTNVEKNIGNHFEEIAKKSLVSLDEEILFPFANEKKLEEAFSQIKKSHPEVESVFAINSCHCKSKGNEFGYIYSDKFNKIDISEYHNSDKKNRIDASKHRQNSNYHSILHLFEKATSREQFINKNRSLPIWQKDNKESDKTYIFYDLRKKNGRRGNVFLAVSLNEEYVKQKLLSEIVGNTLKSSTSAISASNSVIRISDNSENNIFTTTKGNQNYVHKTQLEPPFYNWSAEIGFKDADIESVARTNFWKNLIVTLSILGILVLGLLLTIRAANREIKLAQAKSAFVSNVSHELKTPLSLIRLFVEMLELGYVKNDSKIRKYYSVINHESRRLSHLIDNILDFSKIESGHRNYDFKDHNIGEIVSNVLSNYSYHIDKAEFNLTVNIENNLPSISVDSDAITQAIINLIDNAIKYSPDKKEISITVKNNDSHITLEVADYGKGIAKDEHKKIFEKFYRADDGLIHDVKGSGLGLALVKHIVEAHQGKIYVKSKINEGSRFIIELPITAKTSEKNSLESLTRGGLQIVENSDS